jgi:RND family efflux transporter MFP subunit
MNTIFCLCLLVACSEEVKPDKLQGSKESIAVKTYKLSTTESSNHIHCTGTIDTDQQLKYSFKIGGVIEKILVREGDSFKKGTLLATLKVDEIDSGVSQAQLGVDKAIRDLKRIQNLYRDSVATLEQLQNAQTLLDVAQNQLQVVTFNRNFACIYAGVDGFVTKKLANEGEIISEGMPVFVINEARPSSWILTVGISDKDWANIQVNNKAKISIDAYPGIQFEGYVFKKLLAANPDSGSFAIEIKVNPNNKQLALGMFGRATVETNLTAIHKAIPYDAVIEANGNNAFVFIPQANGKVRKHPIQIASFDNQSVYVASGLEDIDEIVVNNSAFLNENSTIIIIQ